MTSPLCKCPQQNPSALHSYPPPPSSSSPPPSSSNLLSPFQVSVFISKIHNASLSFTSPVTSCKVFPFFVSFHTSSSHSILGLPLTHVSTLVPHTCQGFLLLSILIRCPNHLSSLLSTILVTGSWFCIPLIWLFLILSLLVFPMHFLMHLISVPVILLSCFVNVVHISQPQNSAER